MTRVTLDRRVQSYDPASIVGRSGGEDAAGR
jgi:hypothetical protein